MDGCELKDHKSRGRQGCLGAPWGLALTEDGQRENVLVHVLRELVAWMRRGSQVMKAMMPGLGDASVIRGGVVLEPRRACYRERWDRISDKDEWGFARMLRWLEGRPFYPSEKICEITFKQIITGQEKRWTHYVFQRRVKNLFDVMMVRGPELNTEHAVANATFIY